MDNQERNTADAGKAGVPDAPQQAAPANPSRRRFARLGAGTSGVILTLASGSGMAQVVCAAPSGSFSLGTKSHQPTAATNCNGVSPGYWKVPQHTWPVINTTTTLRAARLNNGLTDQQQRDTLFSSVFPGGSTKLYQTGTMQNVLDNTDPSADPYNLGMHLVAAYLNVMSNRITFIDAETLGNMWRGVVTYGYYKPSNNVQWNAEQVKNYLQSTEY